MKIFIFIISLLWIMGQGGESVSNGEIAETEIMEQESVSQEPEYIEYYEQVLTFVKMNYESNPNFIPEALDKYLSDALINDTLIEDLSEIEAEYEMLDAEEKTQFLNDCKPINLLSYEYYTGTDSDKWYLVDLHGKGKKDIVIWHQGEEWAEILFFERYNENSYHKALYSGGQRKSQPYFIQWEGKNYMAIPYWDENEENIIGVTVHRYDDPYWLMGIGIDENSQISTCYWGYNIGGYHGEAWYSIK